MSLHFKKEETSAVVTDDEKTHHCYLYIEKRHTDPSEVV
jgi:hypothetical protein